MELTKKQQEGLDIALERYNNGERYTVIAGYAGTGKSTLIRHIIQALPVKESEVVYTSFTGKATQVLQKKGNKNVRTLHKLLYKHFLKPDGTYAKKPRSAILYKVVVVDEVSMAPKSLMEMLYRHKNVYIICCGDPFQLPPIYETENNHLLDEPHIFLDEVMRQAQESEIIQLTMKIRNGEPIQKFQGKEVMVLDKKDLSTGMLTWADQIICATNKTRENLNTQCRQIHGFEGPPQEGDKVICLKNYWDTVDAEQESVLVNGTIGYLKHPQQQTKFLPRWIKGASLLNVINSYLTTDDGTQYCIQMDKKMLEEGIYSLSQQAIYSVFNANKRKGGMKIELPQEFAYGYAITCHKSQGSEWDNVLVIEEGFPYKKDEHARWLYTACTRAASRLVLIR